MSSNIWFIADTHFGHRNIIKYEKEKRPFSSIEEHDEHLIQEWNKVVHKRDTVWHLGDFCFGPENIGKVAPRLKGIKKLILGNHDCYDIAQYAVNFDQVYGAFHYKGFVLTHIPVHNMSTHLCGNIHGHLHSRVVEGSNNHICVSVEHTGLRPINFDEIKDIMKKRGQEEDDYDE